ncbi:MAG TPA: metallophosphoesterase family protein [Desulfuromonadaceae bacterium]|nr:metallophosphoesterase family protein [Desulfuromonadaceae bacterium]
MRIGVISDTHNFLDPKVATLLAGVDHILHGGDVGQTRLILELEEIAPVTAVLGNTDDAGMGLKLTENVELAGKRFLIHHIVNPRSLEESIAARIRREKPHVVVFGHTHKPFCGHIDGTMFFNPGYAGNSRFGMERSLAILHCDGNTLRAEYLKL